MTEIELQIKNPAQNLDGDYKLRVPQDATVGDVKAKLESDYPSRPERGSITVIYAGRVLKQDDAPLASFLQQVRYRICVYLPVLAGLNTENVDPSTPHTLHIVVKPGQTSASSPAPRVQPTVSPPAGQSTQPPPPERTPTSQPQAAAGPSSSSHQAQQAAPGALHASTPAAAQPPTSEPAPAPTLGAGSTGQVPMQPAVSAPIQGYAYTIPSPYAIYNPALSAAYTAALQALQAAMPPAPATAAAAPNSAAAPVPPGQVPGAAEGPLAAFNAALQTLQAGQPAVNAEAAAAQAAGALGVQPGAAAAAGQAAAVPGVGQPGLAPAAAAGAAVPGPGLVGMPPLALPLAQIAYVPAFIPVPQPVLTAIPNPQFGQGMLGQMPGAAGAQQGGVAEGQQPGQQHMAQGFPGAPPGMGQFIPVPGGVMFPAGPAEPPMQVHVVEAGDHGLRRRRVDPNQPGAVPPEVVEALRAAQQRGQLPGNLAGLVAQLQRQQAARRADARRARGFQIHINLGRINMRAIVQLVFMLVIMAPYFSLRRLALMLGIAALLNVARLEAVRRALNRLAGQHHLPLQPGEGGAGGPRAAAGQGQQEGGAEQAAPGGAPVGAAGAPEGPAPVGHDAAPGAAAAGEQAGQGGEVGAGAAPQQPQRARRGIVQEIQALVVGFITSLLPGWNVNPEDAAAFAAAEEAARAEEQAAAAAAGI